ncbi:MAG: SEC-C domain-containing protein [Lachnospiraceae bacterium]|jgi:hypothetical protein|nr:SEC-C domain-containing protein [Lachnospiraceae bacterium]
MATLLETWRTQAYGDGLSKAEQEQLWQEYFALEKGFYEEILKDPSHVFEGTVKELADHFHIDVFHFTGVLDGIDESLKGYHNPIDSMDENTQVKIEIDPEKLYYNMVEAKASWLYGLPAWESILSEEKRHELYRQQKASGTIRREGKKIYPNDQCPCGSGKKYKKCHMRIDQENELKAMAGVNQ